MVNVVAGTVVATPCSLVLTQGIGIGTLVFERFVTDHVFTGIAQTSSFGAAVLAEDILVIIGADTVEAASNGDVPPKHIGVEALVWRWRGTALVDTGIATTEAPITAVIAMYSLMAVCTDSVYALSLRIITL